MRLDSGKLAILLILFLALASVVTSGLYHWNRQHEAADYWGRSTSVLIAQSPRLEALLLAPAFDVASNEGEIHTVDGKYWQVIERKDASQARGFGHLRTSLLASSSFDWVQPLGDCRPEWRYGLSFRGESGQVTVLFAPNCRRVTLSGSDRTVALVTTMDAVSEIMGNLFSADARPPSKK